MRFNMMAIANSLRGATAGAEAGAALGVHPGHVGGRGAVAAALPAVRRRDRPAGQDRHVHGGRAVPVVYDQAHHRHVLGVVPVALLPGAGGAEHRGDVAHLLADRLLLAGRADPGQGLGRKGDKRSPAARPPKLT